VSVRPGSGFWIVTAGFVVIMAYSTVPTPLFPLYERSDRFPVSVVTVVFAAYAIGVIGSLVLFGPLSDRVGRRRILIVAALVAAVSAALFLLWRQDVAGLIVARIVNGAAIGLATGTATAYLGELRAVARPDERPIVAASIASAANLGGLAIGPLIGGLFAEALPAPLILPHAVFLVLLVLVAIALTRVPETVAPSATGVAYRPQRLSLPPAGRSAFVAAGSAAFAGFAVFGVLSSLAPAFLVSTFDDADHLVAGSFIFAVFAASALGRLALGSLALSRQVSIAVVACASGLIAVAIGAVSATFLLFVLGGIIAGLGVGVMFKAAVATAAAMAEPHRRAETLALLFLIAYAGVAVPILVVGVALLVVPLVPVLLVFTALVLIATVWAGLAMRAR